MTSQYAWLVCLASTLSFEKNYSIILQKVTSKICCHSNVLCKFGGVVNPLKIKLISCGENDSEIRTAKFPTDMAGMAHRAELTILLMSFILKRLKCFLYD